MKITTIKLEKKTKERLDKLKTHRRETYDEVLLEILDVLNLCRINPEKARFRLLKINRSHKNLTQKQSEA